MTEIASPAESDLAAAERRARVARADRISGVILVLLILASFGLVLRTIGGIVTGPPPPKAGIEAPAFGGLTPTGAPLKLADHSQKVVLIDFWATWCPPCVASMPALEHVYREYKDRGFVVIGVNQEAGEEATVRDFVRAREVTFPILMDTGAIAKDYGVFTFPTSFLIGKDGVIRSVHRGVTNESQLRQSVEALLGELPASNHAGRAG